MSEAVVRSELPEPVGFEAAVGAHIATEKAKTAHGKGYGAYSAKVRYIGWGMLTGWQAISDYLGVCISTAERWRKRERLPVANLPDGRVAISLSLIDQWLMARYEAQSACVGLSVCGPAARKSLEIPPGPEEGSHGRYCP